MENYQKTINRQSWDTKINFWDPSSNSKNPKIKVKTRTKKTFIQVIDDNSFRYHHYEYFCSQIDLTKLTIVKGRLGNSLNKKCVCFSDAAPLKM